MKINQSPKHHSMSFISTPSLHSESILLPSPSVTYPFPLGRPFFHWPQYAIVLSSLKNGALTLLEPFHVVPHILDPTLVLVSSLAVLLPVLEVSFVGSLDLLELA